MLARGSASRVYGETIRAPHPQTTATTAADIQPATHALLRPRHSSHLNDGLLPDLHGGHALVPGLDHLAQADLKGKRLLAGILRRPKGNGQVVILTQSCKRLDESVVSRADRSIDLDLSARQSTNPATHPCSAPSPSARAAAGGPSPPPESPSQSPCLIVLAVVVGCPVGWNEGQVCTLVCSTSDGVQSNGSPEIARPRPLDPIDRRSIETGGLIRPCHDSHRVAPWALHHAASAGSSPGWLGVHDASEFGDEGEARGCRFSATQVPSININRLGRISLPNSASLMDSGWLWSCRGGRDDRGGGRRSSSARSSRPCSSCSCALQRRRLRAAAAAAR